MTYVIGDVHGEFDSLRRLVNKFPKETKLIFVGDLVDRGKKSKEVVEFVKNNNFLYVLGNHEKMMIEYALWNRKEPKIYVPIFNIFGHTIQKEVDLTKHFIDVDTGCCYANKG
ncbi:MAG: metallophosphoesterase [Arcobacter sp.]|jgi:Icc-related predicted phosphoesterase|uniref:metallophosphoesterase n=1 Tax=Arcobacter sp. TaxID=1872629 RepID=UPI002A75EBC3|nr:metallophosphoesterase [Arcobacter sp.]MDY3205617.1 metallophosphoesterase [Arcobacter sp.]